MSPLLATAATTLPALQQFIAAAGLVIPTAPSLWENAAVCVLQNVTVQSFLCPFQLGVSGMNAGTKYSLLDSLRVHQTAFNPTTTSAIEVEWNAISLGSSTLIGNEVVLTMGVRSVQPVFNGFGSAGIVSSVPTLPAGPSTSLITTITNLTIGPNHYPVTGTVEGAFVITNPPAATTTATVKITYDGSPIGTIVTTVGNVQTRTCTVDLRLPLVAATCTPP